LLYIPSEVAAATIYGTIHQNNQPLRNTEVILDCGKGPVPAKTDDRGTYRLTSNHTGRCNLRVGTANGEVVLYQDPTRYDFEIISTGGQARLNRK